MSPPLKNGFLSPWISFLTKEFLTFVVAAVLLLIVLPILFIVSTPIFLFRLFVKITSKWFRSDLASVVTCRGTVYAVDRLYTKPRCNIINALLIQEKVTLEEMRELTTRTLLNTRFPDNKLKYPELKQYLTKWMGFHFWKNEADFDIQNHVYPYSNNKKQDVHSESDIEDLMKELLKKPWREGRALWEIILIQNSIQTESGKVETVLFFRIHHTLADAYSIYSLLSEGLSERVKIAHAVPQYHQRTVLNALLFGITFPFRCAYEISEMCITSFKCILWKPTPFASSAVKQTGNITLGITNRIEVGKLKSISKHFGVTFTSVINAALAGAIRETLKRKNVSIPSILPFNATMPLPGHSPRLRNYFGACVTYLPVGEEDSEIRLRYCGKDNDRIKASTILPFVSKMWIPIVGAYFPKITEFVYQMHTFYPAMTNTSFGQQPFSINGKNCIGFKSTPDLLQGNTGCFVTFNSYLDSLRMNIVVDELFMSQEDVDKMLELFVKEIDIFYSYGIV